MKKIVSIVLTILLVVAMLPVPALAAGNPYAVLTSATGNPGGTVTLTVSLSGLEKATSIAATIEADEALQFLGDSAWLLNTDGAMADVTENMAYWAVNNAVNVNDDVLKLVYQLPEKFDKSRYDVKVTISVNNSNTVLAENLEFTASITCAHNYAETVVAPNCTELGHTEYLCESCGNKYYDNSVPALDHDWDDGVVTKEPTTTEKGEMTYTCQREGCGVSATKEIPVLIAPIITAHPKSVSAIENTTAEFKVVAVGTNLSYQWEYRSSANGNWANATATGNKTATLSVPATDWRSGYQYRCKITDGNGLKVYSEAATLTVVTGPYITSQPESVTTVAGITVEFTVEAGGTDLSYQWEYRTSSTGSWSNSPATGNATATLSVPATDRRSGYQYRCKITDGDGESVYSDVVTLTVVTDRVITGFEINNEDEIPSLIYNEHTTPYGIQPYGMYNVIGAIEFLVTYNDGTTETLHYDQTTADGQAISMGRNLNGPDGVNTFTFSLAGFTIVYESEFIESPVESLEIISEPSFTLGVDSDVSKQGRDYILIHFQEDYDRCYPGLKFRINYKDGTSEEVNFEDLVWPGYETSDAWASFPRHNNNLVEVQYYMSGGGYEFSYWVGDISHGTNRIPMIMYYMGQIVHFELEVKENDTLMILRQLEDQNPVWNKVAEFKIGATGQGLSYQWQYRANETADWQNCEESTAVEAVLNVVAKADVDGNQYRCIVSDADGNTLYSDAATLTVHYPHKMENGSTSGCTYALSDLVLGDDSIYRTPDGYKMYIAIHNVEDGGLEWLNGNTLKDYVDAYEDAYFDLTHWDALVAKMDENGYVVLTEETLEALVVLITGKPAWGETREDAKWYLAYDYSTEESEALELTLWTYPIGQWSSPEALADLIAQFEEANPGITVMVESLDYMTGDGKVNDAIAEGTAPDLIMEGPERLVATWGAQGAMVDLSDLLDDDDRSEIYANALAAGVGANGELYQYPLAGLVHTMAINKTVFEAAGAMQYLNEETHTWNSTEDFFKAVQAVYEYTDKTVGIVYCNGQGGDQGTRALITNLYGGSYTNAAHTAYTWDSEPMLSALEALYACEGIAIDAGKNGGDEMTQLKNGDISMSFCWNINQQQSLGTGGTLSSGDEVLVMAFPSTTTPQLQGGIWGLGVFDNGDDARTEAAKAFVKFVCDSEATAEAVELSGYFPMRSNLSDVYSDDAVMCEYDKLTQYMGDYYQVTPNWAASRGLWYNMLQAVGAGKDISATAKAYSAEANGQHTYHIHDAAESCEEGLCAYTAPTEDALGSVVRSCVICHGASITETCYPVTEGDEEEVIVDENTELPIHIDCDIEDIANVHVDVYVDGEKVAPENYTVTEGSIIITLKPEYLATLEPGEHTMTVKFADDTTDGTASAKFSIVEITPTTNKHGYSSQVGLIEPWFIRVNMKIADSNGKIIDCSTLIDYGAYFIRRSDLTNPAAKVDELTIGDIKDNAHSTAYKKGEAADVTEADNHAVFQDGDYLCVRYREGIYTYQMSDPIVYVFWYKDTSGLHFAKIREINLSEFIDSRIGKTGEQEDAVYQKISKLEEDILAYRAQYEGNKTVEPQQLYTVSESELGTPESEKAYVFASNYQITLIEPWGLRINYKVAKNETGRPLCDYGTADDYGLILYHSHEEEQITTLEELLSKEDAYVFSKTNGNSFIDGDYFCVRYNEDIYTYQFESNVAYAAYYVVDGKYYYSSVKNRNLYNLVTERIEKCESSYEVSVYEDMIGLYEAIQEYREWYFGTIKQAE